MDITQDLSVFNRNVAERLDKMGKVILVGSGKGGVGKSFIASGLACSLSTAGYRTGIIDLDIHGASLPNYLGVGPPLRSGRDGLEPRRAGRTKVMSVSLLTGDHAVPVLGQKKRELIWQLFSITNWGELDYLVVDLPPGTGDEVLSSFDLFSKKCSLLLVTTPSPNALRIVSRLANLARIERVQILGIVVNMAYSKIGRRVTFPFGRTSPKSMEKELGSKIIARYPLDPRVGSQSIRETIEKRGEIATQFKELTEKVSQLSSFDASA